MSGPGSGGERGAAPGAEPARRADQGNDLFGGADGPSEPAPSPFSGAAGGATEAARARIGRPPGARNRRDADAEKWYFAQGYVDPMQRLGELVSEDARVLQAWFEEHGGLDAEGKPRTAPTILEVIRMQIAAAGELMPYLHGKKPIDLNIIDERLPQLIIAAGTNQLDQARELLARRVLSLGAPVPAEEASEIKDLEGER